MVDIFFNFSPRTGNLRWKQISKTKCTNKLNCLVLIFVYFWNKLPNQIKNRNRIEKFKIKLNDLKNEVQKKNLKGHFRYYQKNC